MDATRLNQQIGDLAATLGDATRRGIYITVRESVEPVTAGQIGELFDIHTNVARHHLDRLVADGYLQVTRKRKAERRGPGAGRPAKHYETTEKEISVQFPARRYDLLAELLARIVERVAPDSAAEIAEEVGREYGRELAAEVGIAKDTGFDTAITAVAKVMLGVGFETEASAEDRVLLTRFCPFGETAAKHSEIVCKLDQGIVSGLLESTNASGVPIVNPHLGQEADCVTEI
ncbi:MAG: helix-turn-helix domain-containing protein [Acidimicrobiia bacterium]|nr:helix-turn-helix domain-containing protein [Acidimicrobiia bacterium]